MIGGRIEMAANLFAPSPNYSFSAPNFSFLEPNPEATYSSFKCPCNYCFLWLVHLVYLLTEITFGKLFSYVSAKLQGSCL